MRLNPRTSVTLYYVGVVLIFFGGVFMLLLTGGILSIQNDDPFNLVLNEPAELLIFSVTGVVLVSSPFWLIPYMRRTLKRRQAIKVGVNHHARNRVQEILVALELLESEAASKQQLRLIESAKASCLAMIDSLSKVVQEDGEKVDYSLAMKEYSESSR